MWNNICEWFKHIIDETTTEFNQIAVWFSGNWGKLFFLTLVIIAIPTAVLIMKHKHPEKLEELFKGEGTPKYKQSELEMLWETTHPCNYSKHLKQILNWSSCISLASSVAVLELALIHLLSLISWIQLVVLVWVVVHGFELCYIIKNSTSSTKVTKKIIFSPIYCLLCLLMLGCLVWINIISCSTFSSIVIKVVPIFFSAKTLWTGLVILLNKRRYGNK